MAYDGSIKIDTKIDTSGFSTGIEKMKSAAAKGVSTITTTLTAVATGIAAGGTAATKVGSAFESGMSKVSAISGATGSALEALTDKAKEMGAKTKFSASESAEALQYMSMAGWETEDMLSGIDGIMSLAAADGLDLATTSDIVTDAITAFGLEAKDSSHFADVLAKASSSANTNVSMLGESFKYVAPLAGTMGYSAEDVSVALGLMANASVKGSMAGTSLKTALSNLASPTQAMADIMSEYGISISDTEGNALPLLDVLKQLREKFGGLSETEQAAAASTLFGKEAMSGMLAIINASDSDFSKLVENISNADGAAQNMADTMQDNLQGQITILKSTLEGLGIEIYEGMSEPLKDAAVQGQNYVNRLTDAFQSGGLNEMVSEAGEIFGELAVKAAEAAPQMVEAAVSFIEAFADGIADNANQLASAAVNIVKTVVTKVIEAAPKLLSAAKAIVSAIVDNLVKLLPSHVQKPVKDTINTIKKSFESGGLKSAIDTVKNMIVNFGKAVTNVAKVVLPPLAKAIDFAAGSLKTMLPIVTAVYTAYKSYQIIAIVTALFKAHTAAVTAESLAEAASLGTITLKQIAIGALTGEITLATAAQYAWNLAMSMNPIGAVIAAVAALAAGIAMLALTMDDTSDSTAALKAAQEKLATANENLGSSYEEIGNKFTDFMNEIDSAGSIFDNFNENILISDDEKQAIADNMDSVQSEISEICRQAAEERRELTGGEIQRLNELFEKMHELSEQELALEKSKQSVVVSQAEALNSAAGISLDEYEQRSQKLANSAEETRAAVIGKAYEQYTEEVALLDLRLDTDAEYSKKEHDADVQVAEERYQSAIDSANKEAGDTLAILEQGYRDRATALTDGTANLKRINKDEEDENAIYSSNIQKIEKHLADKISEINESRRTDAEKTTARLFAEKDAQKLKEEENARHETAIAKTRNAQQQILNDENYKKQFSAWSALESLYETYTGKIGDCSEDIIDAYFAPMENLDKDTKANFQSAVDGAIEGCEDKKDSLFYKAAELADGFIGRFKSIFDIHSPSRAFRKMFRQNIEGGELGNDDEAPKLYKQADKIGDTFSKRMQSNIKTDGLVAKMRAGVDRGRALVSQTLSAKVVHDVSLHNDENNRKYVLKGDIHTTFSVDGRETAVALTPYVSEELAWEGR